MAYDRLTDVIGSRFGHSKLPSDTISDDFIFIETVVSGQTAQEIARAMHAQDISKYCRMILLVDAGRGKFTQGQFEKIARYIPRDRIDCVYFDSLFTEDEGPAYTEVLSVVYSNLVSQMYGSLKGTDGNIVAKWPMHFSLCATQGEGQRGRWQAVFDYLSNCNVRLYTNR